MTKKIKPKKKASKHKLAETISIVSHQLKTPLSAIKGYLEVLMSEEGKEEEKEGGFRFRT